MRSLFVRNLFLWPRFHATIQATLKEHQVFPSLFFVCAFIPDAPYFSQPDVIELRLPLTQDMVTIQTATLDLIQFTLKELKRINPSVTMRLSIL